MAEREKNKKEEHIKHYLNDVYTKEEAEQFFDTVKEDDEYLDNSLINIWEESNSLNDPTPLEKQQLKQEAYALLAKKKRTNRYTISISRQLFRKISTVAAAVAAMLIIGLGSLKYWEHRTINSITNIESVTSFGESQSVTLPDGTLVYLNSCSKISYPDKFEGDERKIFLDGEAYFNVAKNEKQPFIVETKRFDVKVLGTVFNVKSYDGDELLAVSVESGKVQVDMPDAMLRLVANEEMSYNIKSDEYNKYKEDRKVAIWRDGYFRFSKTPIKDVIRELERAYNCHISIKAQQDFDNLITGEHPNTSLEDILKTIQYATGIKYNINKELNEIILYK
ncbi:MAG: FecR domain-containing protein [Prevotella sp.]|jgi:ferric-dicitrate binding protein FerR (iron transport regulator)|nr:FecR domain-containing protein [Prevotella sp.]